MAEDAPADLLAAAAWECACSPPGVLREPGDLDGAGLDWLRVQVPGTAGAALRGAARWDGQEPPDLDGSDWWFRCRSTPAPPGVPLLLRLAGLATVADVWAQGRLVLHSEDMFLSHEAELPAGTGPVELVVRCAALTPLLSPSRRPRARWRSGLVERQELRWWRSSLLGRMPGLAGTTAVVGPWRPVRLVAVPPVRVVRRHLLARVDGGDGLVDARLVLAGPVLHGPAAADTPVVLRVGDARQSLDLVREGEDWVATGRLRLPDAQLWWPHTHGAQPRYDVSLDAGGHRVPLGRLGFRTVQVDRREGAFTVSVNGVPVFLRGAVWVPPDPVSLAAPRGTVRAALEQVVAAGMNLVRVVGTAVYEDETFWDLCDELGVAVWQDAMFATLDYPDDEGFLAAVERELREVLAPLASRPSLLVLSGGSETEQQPALLGLPPARTTVAALTRTLPAVAAALLPGVPVLTSTPTGSTPGTRVDQGVAHWFGVGAYLRPLADTRQAGVRFAAECLAFAVPPERATVEQEFGDASGAGHAPAWKRTVPRDRRRGWDFEDVTNHYVRALFAVDPVQIRYAEPERALDLARATVAEVVSTVLAEWRRAASPCSGAVILALRDLVPGAGWGVVDALGQPKAPWWALRRVLAPVALLLSDEGLSGLRAHVVNDTGVEVGATVRVELFTRGELLVETAQRETRLPPRSQLELDLEEVLGGFRDIGWSHRFGPPAHDVVAVSLLGPGGSWLGGAVHLPLGLARPVEPDLGLRGEVAADPGGWLLRVSTRRFAQSVVAEVPGFHVEDAWFALPPGAHRELRLTPASGVEAPGGTPPPAGQLRALNAALPVQVGVAP